MFVLGHNIIVALPMCTRHVLSNGRPTLLQPCENELTIKEPPVPHLPATHPLDYSGINIFTLTPHDNNQGLSTEDRAFLQEVNKEFKKNADGNWEAPLPLRSQRPRLPNN